jgi:uncharacterized protein (DUF58 family)
MKRIKDLFLTDRFFIVLLFFFLAYVLAFFFPVLYSIVTGILFLFFGILLWDIFQIFKKGEVVGDRKVGDKLSNGDDNIIPVEVENKYKFPIFLRLIDELPIQFQKRDFNIKASLNSNEEKTFGYSIRPTKRGEYTFGSLHIFVKSKIGLIERRFSFNKEKNTKVYPSFLQLKKYRYLLSDTYINSQGDMHIPKLGNTLEFEQINEYVQGDDIRLINWKATAKKNQLMINQYRDEKAQQVYVLLDMGRVMRMPFNELSLLDHSINCSLILMQVILKRGDKAGLISFSNKVGTRLAAQSRGGQMLNIQESLYSVNTDYFETDFGALYMELRKNVTQRSFLLLFSNFETLDAMKRQLKYLKAIAKSHVLLLVFFENTEVQEMATEKVLNSKDLANQIIARDYILEKKRIVKELKRHEIRSLLTKPSNLTFDTINAYISIKNSGLI